MGQPEKTPLQKSIENFLSLDLTKIINENKELAEEHMGLILYKFSKIPFELASENEKESVTFLFKKLFEQKDLYSLFLTIGKESSTLYNGLRNAFFCFNPEILNDDLPSELKHSYTACVIFLNQEKISSEDDYDSIKTNFGDIYDGKAFENGLLFYNLLKKGLEFDFNIQPDQLKICLDSYLEHCISHNRPYSIELLEKIYQKYNIDKTIPPTLIKRYEKLSRLTDKDFFERILSQFELPPTCGSRITKNGAAVFLAATNEKKLAENKSYTFNPTIFDETDFKSYLTILKNSKTRPINEKFIITSNHWVSGEISIDENGAVKVFIEEPITASHYQYSFSNDIKDVFLGANIDTYFSYYKKQNDYDSCSLFALDALKHFFNENEFLGKNSSGEPYKNIFQYLDDHIKENITLDGVTIHQSEIPSRNMRPAQTSRLLSDKYGIDPTQIVNTKRQSFEKSYLKNLLIKEDGLGKINKRLDEKRKIMYRDLERYLFKRFKAQYTAQLKNPSTTPLSLKTQCISDCQPFFLEGLEKRLNPKNVQPVSPISFVNTNPNPTSPIPPFQTSPQSPSPPPKFQ